jgi:hypothetical protein
MPDSVEVDFGGTAEGDAESRVLRGIACPPDATVERWGRTVRIPTGSVRFGERTPLLGYHNDAQPIGKLISSEWTDAGLMVAFKVSEVPAGDEALRLAADGVLGLSMGLRIEESAVRAVGTDLVLTDSLAFEVSVTPLPALAGADILSVTFTAETHMEGAATMPEEIDVAALNATLKGVTDTLVTLSQRPVPQPVAPAVVTREPVPEFSVQDLRLSLAGDHGATERLERHFLARFAVSEQNTSALTPTGYRADLYVGERPYVRTLSQLITQETLSNNASMDVPFLKNATGPWVSDHVQNVEPDLAGGAVWDTQSVKPKPLSGKVSIVQEALDLTGGQVANMLWNIFLAEWEKALERKMAEFLDGLTLPPDQVVDVDGTDSDLADSFDSLMLSLREDRWTGLAAESSLYRDFFRARDEDKRKLFAAVGQVVNADGSANNRRVLDIGGTMAVQSRDTASSYLVDRNALWQGSTIPTRFDIRTRVASLELGFFAYQVCACLDPSGVIRINHAA